jgi:hypothetical protein
MVRKQLRQTRKRRGGGLGPTSATWPPDNTSFGRFAGSPLNADNLEFEKSPKGGSKRRRSRKTRRRRRGGDPIPSRDQQGLQTYDVKPKDSSAWKGYDTHKVEAKMGQYDLYKKKIPLKK